MTTNKSMLIYNMYILTKLIGLLLIIVLSELHHAPIFKN